MTIGEGHIASAFSILDILWVLYDRVLRIDPKNPKSDERDRFLLSKGHGSLSLYAVLAEKGFFPVCELERFGTFDSFLGGHPDCNNVPGVEASTGSLGHGLPMAVGMALGMRIRKVNRRVFVLVGDGECNEGSIWESALLAVHHRLSNLTCIVDYNHSTDRALLLGDLAAKFTSFGWATATVNGHDHHAIHNALVRTELDCPTAVVAETVKGFGCKQMENNPAWHHRAPTQDDLAAILEELA
jgi:transketolase